MCDPTLSYPTEDDFVDLLTDSAPVGVLSDSHIPCAHWFSWRRFC